MDDVELSELVKQFQALQKDGVADQITDRNVVEIVNTLIEKRLVELLYTTDAKEYLTWDELRREIVEEVYASGGRVNVVDVPGLLSVNTYHIERVLPDILASDSTLLLEGGELLTVQYLDMTVQTAADALKEHGSLSVAQFATKHHFTSAFALGLLTRAIEEGRLSAVVQDSALYTKSFVRSQRIILRSGLLAAEQPVDVEALYKRHGLFAPLMDTLIKHLTGELPGKFHGHVYTPKVFEVFRAEQVHNIYASNGVVTYAALQALGISNARQYLVGRYNPGAGGGNGDASDAGGTAGSPPPPSPGPSHGGRRGGGGKKRGGKNTAAGAVGASGNHAGGGGGAVTVVRADEQHPHCGYPLSGCFLSDRHLGNLMGLNPLLDGEVLALDVTQLFPMGVDLSKDWATLLPRLTELYPLLATCELVEDTVLVRRDAEETVRLQLLEALKAEAAKASTSKKGIKKATAAADQLATIRQTVAKALHLHADHYERALAEIMEQWSGTIDEVRQRVEAAKKDSASADLRHSRAALQTSLANAWVELGIVAKGLQWAKDQVDDATYATLCRNSLSTRGLVLCRDVVLNESLDQPELHAKVVDALLQATTPGNFKKGLAPFPEKTRESLAPLVAAVNEKELTKLMDALQEMSSSGVIAVSSFYPPNKKLERDVKAKMKEGVESDIRTSSFTVDDVAANGSLFTSITCLLALNQFHAYLEIPGKGVGAVVTRVAKEANAPPLLAQALDIITASLQKGSVEADKVAVLEQLRTSILA